ncbi:serine hydrolase domain-containing protein [uncultured Chitinophaga sp.]|jgi:Beta-lactamase class C and other penicillin binding proteins|uniref:serine hydrolase domain-containing protein n=1 Tax=uncultured Chitinophaga sp. TaxID=339340 RepID=UPI0026282999|nr:serine hydrolase domain-containing protein [uncultured Chitinophaga sp.]
MKAFVSLVLLFAAGTLLSCKKDRVDEDPGPPAAAMYFPPLSGSAWETSSAASLGWKEAQFNDLYTYLAEKHTKAFLILKDGRIVQEKYFGSFTADSLWYWASAGKTMTAFLTGIAQQEGMLNINNKTSQYLGAGWTAAPQAKEDLITIRHQLTMSTGLDDGVPDDFCTAKSCLVYKADAGTRWAYHNAPYTILDQVIEKASGQSFNNYFNAKIRSRIGMKGAWIKAGYNNIYYSDARSMARFGLLMLNKGTWDQTAIMTDTSYFNSMVNSSQPINPAYGYLCWLNGKANYMLPQTQIVFNGNLVPTAPADLYAALGKNDQKLYIVPSQRLVVVRMGESAGNSRLALSSFDTALWGKLRSIIGY